MYLNRTTDNKVLEAEVAILRARVRELEKLENAVSSIFTRGQMRKLFEPKKLIHWEWEDISSAIALHAAGPRAYGHLCKNGFPFPCESTIKKWLQKVTVDEGVLSFSLNVLRSANEAPLEDRLCILSFDEMKVESLYEYDAISDTVRQPYNYVQLAIARGLKSSWKQPVFCAFDCKMTKTILENLVIKLQEAGYTVVGVVSDMGSGNQSLWKELNVSSGMGICVSSST